MKKINKQSATHFYDIKFRTDYKHYIFQSIIIFFCITLLLLLWRFFDDIVIASLGASTFILFASPHSDNSRPRYVICGYICGILSGLLFNVLYNITLNYSFKGKDFLLIIICAAAVAVTAFVMVVTNSEHPPAAALALGLSVEASGLNTALASIIGIIVLCSIKQIIKKHLKNLI